MSLLMVTTAFVVAAYQALSRRLAHSTTWNATLTPLSSIMGSGFLVSAPLLGAVVRGGAVLAMAGLLLLAYCVGGAIRFNIVHFEPVEERGPEAPRLERRGGSSVTLAVICFRFCALGMPAE